MRHVHIGLGVLAALAIIALSGFMNFKFWFAQAITVDHGLALGAASVAFDALKALLPIWITIAFAQRRMLYVAVASTVFVLLFCGSLLSAIGFISATRGEKTGSRETLNARLEITQKELAELNIQISRLSGYPPIATIEANLAGTRQDKRWSSSRGCEDATAGPSRDFCKDYFSTRAQLSAAIEGNRITERRDTLNGEVSRLLDAGAGLAADPQASMISRLASAVRPGLNVDDAKTALMLFFAVLVELCAAFGLFLATRHSTPSLKSSAQTNEGYPVNLQSVAANNQTPQIASKPRRSALGSGRPAPDNHSATIIELEPERPRRFIVDEAALQWSAGK
jgi:hypothetical protein